MSAALHAPLLLILLTAATAHAEEPSAAPPTLTGRWAQLQQTTAVSKVTFIGEVTTTSTSLLLVDIREQGAGLVLRETVCAIHIVSTEDSVTMRIPPAFQRAVSGRERPVKLEPTGRGWRYLQPTQTEVSGARLKNPQADKLPDDEDDPRVLDPDRDGHPGLTVQVRGLIDGDIYVVQRDTSELSGELSADQTRIRGTMRWRVQQAVLDATSVFLSGDPPDSKQHPDPRRSTFQMTRVAPGASCAALIAQRAQLFP